MRKLLILALLASIAACGKDVSKKFPDNSSTQNNGTTGVNNETVGVNNSNNANVAPNNTNNHTSNNLNNTTPPGNNTANNVSNNGTNNGTSNNTTVPSGPTIAYISGQMGTLDGELVLANYGFVHVGGDEGPLLGDLHDFWLDGDADDFEVVVVEWGFHTTNLGEVFPASLQSVLAAAYEWVENGGILLDLSGGFAYNAFSGFYVLDPVLIRPGSYTATARDPSMPYTEFSWGKADNETNMAGIAPSSIQPGDGETLLVDSQVTTCDLIDFECAEPMFDRRTAMFISKDVGQGVVYHGNWTPPLDDLVVETVFSVLPPP